MRASKGFTIVELILVIIVLGILASFAIPKIFYLERSSKVATLEGIAHTLRSTADMVHGIAIINGTIGATGTVSIDQSGTNVAVVYSYPSATSSGMPLAIANNTGATSINYITAPSDPGVYQLFFTQGVCGVNYSSPAVQGGAPSINITIDGC